MIGVFKKQWHGQVHAFSNQYIESTFTLFFIPLGSFFVLSEQKQTIKIPLNKTSLKNYYTSTAVVLGGILFFFYIILVMPFIFKSSAYNPILAYAPAVIHVLTIIYGFYLSYKIGKPSKYEIKKRTIFQSILGINALPEWLDEETAATYFEVLKAKIPHDWIEKISQKDISYEDFTMIYTFLSYSIRLKNNETNALLFSSLDRKITK